MEFKKLILVAASIGAISASGAWAQSATAPAAASTAPAAAPACVAEKLSSDSTVAELLDNPMAKDMLIKHIPALKDNDQIDQARPMTLRSLQAYAADTFTDKVFSELDADLATIPVCAKK